MQEGNKLKFNYQHFLLEQVDNNQKNRKILILMKNHFNKVRMINITHNIYKS